MGTKINIEGIKFAKQADKIDKIEMIGASKFLVTLKDHKGYFMNHHTTSLVNGSKKEIERISEHILDQINTFTEEILNEKLHFLCIVKNINDKRLYKFLQININTHLLKRHCYMKT